LRAKFTNNDSNFFVREVGRGSDVLERRKQKTMQTSFKIQSTNQSAIYFYQEKPMKTDRIIRRE